MNSSNLTSIVPPLNTDPTGSADLLQQIAHEGLEDHYRIPGREIIQRLEHETKILCDEGYAAHILLLKEIADLARMNGIFVGPGRGVMPSSLLCYVLNITGIDPTIHDLPFSGYFDASTPEPPDLRIYTDYVRAEDLMGLIVKQYGNEHIANLTTSPDPKDSAATERRRVDWCFVASGQPISEAPYAIEVDGKYAIPYGYDDLRRMGVPYFDIAPFMVVTFLRTILDQVRLDLASIPLDDNKTFQNIGKGAGHPSLRSGEILAERIKEAEPSSFEALIEIAASHDVDNIAARTHYVGRWVYRYYCAFLHTHYPAEYKAALHGYLKLRGDDGA